MYPTASLFELIEGLGVCDAALLADAPPKLSKIEDVATYSAFIAENPGEEAHDGESADELRGDCGRGVGVPLHVRQDFDSAAGVPRGGYSARGGGGGQAREGRNGGGGGRGGGESESESTHWRH